MDRIQIISEIAGHMRVVRNAGYGKHLDTLPTGDAHPPKNLKRNYAMLRLHLSGYKGPLGAGWIGVSGTGEFSAPAGVKVAVLRSANENFDLNLREIFMSKVDDVRPAIFRPSAAATMTCSEVPLINGVAYGLAKNNVDSEVDGELFFLTERLPCKFCAGVLRGFLQAYPGIKLHLLYMFDHAGRAERRLEVDLDGLADTVHLLELIDANDEGYTADAPKRAHEPKQQGVIAEQVLNIIRITKLKKGDVMVVPPDSQLLERHPGAPSTHFIARINSDRGS